MATIIVQTRLKKRTEFINHCHLFPAVTENDQITQLHRVQPAFLSGPIASGMMSNSQVAYNIQFSGNEGISIKTCDPTKLDVVDLLTFLEAWNIYFEASIAFHLHLVSYWVLENDQ